MENRDIIVLLEGWRMNKKLCLIALIVSSLLTMAACGDKSEEPIELNEFLISEGIALTCDMDKLAESKEYIALMTPSESIGQITDKMSSQDYSMPEDVYLIKLPDDIILRAVSSFSGKIEISDNIIEKLKYKVNGSVFANLINTSYGSEMIAATSLTTWGKSYIQPNGWSDNMMILVQYPDEFSSIVSFVQSGDGVISASSVFVKNGDKDILAALSEFLGTTEIESDHYSSSQLKDLLR